MSFLRFVGDQDDFEKELTEELRAARPSRETELALRIAQAGPVPSPAHQRLILIARKALGKTFMKPKHVMSAMINCPNAASWSIPFGGGTAGPDCPTVLQLLADLTLMRPSVLLHPLCRDLAAAHLADGTSQLRTISICLGHLDDASLSAAA